MCLTVVACGCDRGAGGESSSASTDGVDSLVESIRARVAELERELPTYRHLRLDLTGYSLEGGTLDVFGVEGVSRGGVRKLIATHYGETGRVVQTFYYGDFSADSIIFASELREQYEQPLTGTVARREEAELYFVDGTLLRWRDAEGRARGSATVQARSRAVEISRYSRELFKCGTWPGEGECRRSP